MDSDYSLLLAIQNRLLGVDMKDEAWWNKHVYRDKLGREIQSDELEILLRHPEYKIVEQEHLGPYFISTVWLGVPHGLGALQYFETMVFNVTEGMEERIVECTRYCTLKEAENGHEEAVQQLVLSTGIPRNSE